MVEAPFMDSPTFTWIILPILIFVARIIDVSIGTMRIVYIARREKLIVTVLAFFEIIIWLLAIGQIFKNLNNVACYLAYAFGFALGNYIGMYIENKLGIGLQIVRIISRNSNELLDDLKNRKFGVTLVEGEGLTGPVKIIFTIIKRKALREVINTVTEHDPKAFYSVEDVVTAKEGSFALAQSERKRFYRHMFKMDRKRK